MNLTIDRAQVRHWCLYCPDLILEVEDAATHPDLKDPIGEQGFAHVDCATANGHEVDGPQPDSTDARFAIRQAARDRDNAAEPADGTILADVDLTEAWVRNDTDAKKGDWDAAHWWPMGADSEPALWADVPDQVKDGVRLVVAEESDDSAEVDG